MPQLTPEQIKEYQETGTYSSINKRGSKLSKPWYKKWWAIVLFIGIALSTVSAFSDSISSSNQIRQKNLNPVIEQIQNNQVLNETPNKTVDNPIKEIEVNVVKPSNTNAGLSNDDYYINSVGNKIHSPAYSNTVPVGASARCRDGSYSFSQSRRGTCSHHGGVANWL